MRKGRHGVNYPAGQALRPNSGCRCGASHTRGSTRCSTWTLSSWLTSSTTLASFLSFLQCPRLHQPLLDEGWRHWKGGGVGRVWAGELLLPAKQSAAMQQQVSGCRAEWSKLRWQKAHQRGGEGGGDDSFCGSARQRTFLYEEEPHSACSVKSTLQLTRHT